MGGGNYEIVFSDYLNEDHVDKDRVDFFKVLLENDIKYIYHITKLSNFASILQCGYLYSFKNLKELNIPFKSSSNELSNNLDIKKGLDEYISFSFTPYEFNPNIRAFFDRFKDENFCAFRMDINYLYRYGSVKFTRINATDKNAKVFDDLENFKKLNFSAFKIDKIPDYIKEYELFKQAQAEILVPDKVSIRHLDLFKLHIQKRID